MIATRFAMFQRDLPAICHASGREVGSLTYPDYCEAVSEWLIDTERTRKGA